MRCREKGKTSDELPTAIHVTSCLCVDLPPSCLLAYKQGLTGRVFQLRVGSGSGIGKNYRVGSGLGSGSGIGIIY